MVNLSVLLHLGVVIDQNLKFRQQAVAAKANCTLGLISKCFEHLDIDTLPLLYKTLMHPIWKMQILLGTILYS